MSSRTWVNSGGCDNSCDRNTSGDSVILSSRDTEKGEGQNIEFFRANRHTSIF